jgi:Ni/Co efflux regulator RcnB
MKILKFLRNILTVLIIALMVPAFSGNVLAQQKDGNNTKTQQTSTKKSKHKKHRKHHKKHKKTSKTKKNQTNNNNNSDKK